MDTVFLQERITVTKNLIVAYEGAVEAFATNGGIQTYRLDTGQTNQTVTRADLKQLQETLDTLYNRLVTLQARLNGAASVVYPGY